MSKQQNKYKEKKYTSNKDEENKDLTKEARKKGNKILNEKNRDNDKNEKDKIKNLKRCKKIFLQLNYKNKY